MKLKINEKLLKKVNRKIQYPNLIINQKEIKIRIGDNIHKKEDYFPSSFSFSYDQKSPNKLFNTPKKNSLVKSSFNNRILNSNLVNKYNNLINRKNKENIKNKMFNKAASTSDSLNNSFNNEMKANYFMKSFNKSKDQNDCLFIQKRLIDLSKIRNNPMNNQNKNKNNQPNNQSNYVTNSIKRSDSIKKYQTIFSKYNIIETKDNEKPQELVQNFELFSSKYSINEFFKNENSKRLLTPKKFIKKHKIPKIELHNKTRNEKYAKTEMYKILKNNTLLIIPKLVQMPNIENLKNFRNNKPIFFCQKESVKNNINIMIKNNQKEKNFRLSAMTSKYRNNKNQKLLLNKVNSKEKDKNNSKSKIMKYTPINLNGFAKIPNRLIKLDKYGNKLEQINNNIKNNKGNINRIYTFKKMKANLFNKFSLIKKNIK